MYRYVVTRSGSDSLNRRRSVGLVVESMLSDSDNDDETKTAMGAGRHHQLHTPPVLVSSTHALTHTHTCLHTHTHTQGTHTSSPVHTVSHTADTNTADTHTPDTHTEDTHTQ